MSILLLILVLLIVGSVTAVVELIVLETIERFVNNHE